MHRARRLRQNNSIRSLVRETILTIDDFIYPIFIKDELQCIEDIISMPEIFRFGTENVLFEIEELLKLGIKAVALFPVTDSGLKTEDARESYNPNSLVCRVIRSIKKRFPEMLILADVALDPYTVHGHDGILRDGYIQNDETLEVLTKMSLVQAEAGADILGPSDMMDFRIGAIREVLEQNGFVNTMLMSYCAKYASSLYSPFRDALESENFSLATDIPKDKTTYQMDIANKSEALKEMAYDISESADILMIKPANWYLDIISDFKKFSNLPIAAYQVSGEYSMIMNSIQQGVFAKDKIIYESLIAIKRAGADIILSYFAKYFARQSLDK